MNRRTPEETITVWNRTPEETIAAIRAVRIEERASIFEIAMRFDLDPKTVWNHTKDIPIRLKRGRRATHDPVKVMGLLKQGLHPEIVQERLGISRKWIYRLCRRYYGCSPSELARMEWKAAA